MPTYEYACRACEEHLEVVQSFSDDPLTECPSCGGELRKVFSAAGLIFKGSGWHIKDYSSSTRSSSTDSAKTDSAKSDGGAKDSGAKDSGAKGSAKPDSSTSTPSTTSTTSSSAD
jgi:putative FmdB family regulatory protein